ncbi:MAG: protein kinase domain-containing protein [Isosphaeraceae bacterium]
MATVLRGSNSSSVRRRGIPLPPGSIPLPMPGELIDFFRLEDAIGAGGMGAVFRALDTKLERLVALKLLPPDQAADGEVVRRFYQEGRSAAQLDHENIARVYSIGQDGYLHYIAFEYIEGETIRQRVEQSGPLPVPEAIDIALQIAQALVHASQRGVVHRDIKPSNIILTPQGRAKLVDMGLARRFERGSDHGLTQTGMTLGTFDYISPEQARDPRDVDVRSDLYSLGCTLFHMLTGRPPFPGGTVLQKLIQHQEEPPADVRSMNPAVPAELAGVITKLMAKDRDRRYQSPEQLVRDLLNLAGAVGLERTPAQVEYWMEHGHRPTWERHLVWLLPALGFFVVITGLVWWGYELSNPSSSSAQHSIGASTRRRPQDSNFPAGADGEETRLLPETIVAEPEPANPQAAYPRTIPVNSNEDLLGILASAPRRSVIVLADDGPYLVGERAWMGRSSAPLTNLDLTIRAEAGVRPRLKFADDARRTDPPPRWILQFVGGHVTLDGLEFELEAILPDEPVAAIRGEDTELILRGCSFRRPISTGREGRDVAAVRVHAVPHRSLRGDRPPALYADACHFDGGQVGVMADGPADIVLRDCTMGPAMPSIWFDNARSLVPVPADLRLIHTTILAGEGPVFRFEGGQVRAWVDDCVIAPAGRSPTTLAMIDEPRNLVWRGRGNLFSQIGTYLISAGKDQQRAPITNFATWEQDATEPREVGSRLTGASVWDAADPLKALSQERDNPSRVFLLNSRFAATGDFGARQGPFGSILKNVRPAQRTSSEPTELPAPARRGVGETVGTRSAGITEAAVTPETSDRPPTEATTVPSVESTATLPSIDPMSIPLMPPMPTTGTTAPAESETPGPLDVPTPTPPPPVSVSRAESKKPGTESPTAPIRQPVAPFSDEDVIRSSEQLLTMLKQIGGRGGSLRIGAGVDIEIPTALIEGTGRYQIIAEPGPARPRLRFRPPDVPITSPTDWSVMWKLRSGSLRLEGLDLMMLDQENLRGERVAFAALLPDTNLTMIDCTLTVAVRRASASVFVVQSPSEPAGSRPSERPTRRASTITLQDCFLRSGGDAVTVAAGRELNLDLTNVLVATEGSLVHALGCPRRRPLDPAAIEVRMGQVTSLVKGGLVHLESTPDEPELSSVKMSAGNSIVSTTAGDDPLFRLEGQDQLDQLGNRIRWEARKVAYHRIKTYRRDEIVETGSRPRTYDRENWTRAFLPMDESPMLGNVKFLREADTAIPSWKLGLEDFRLDPDSPAPQVGPDLGKIPSPPITEES